MPFTLPKNHIQSAMKIKKKHNIVKLFLLPKLFLYYDAQMLATMFCNVTLPISMIFPEKL